MELVSIHIPLHRKVQDSESAASIHIQRIWPCCEKKRTNDRFLRHSRQSRIEKIGSDHSATESRKNYEILVA